MDQYKLLSTTEIRLSKTKMQKEWQVRINNGLTYVFTLIYNQPSTKIVVKLNNCVIESVARTQLSLPIKIEDLEFTVIFKNSEGQLELFNQDIEKNVAIRRLQPLEYEEVQELIVKLESYRQSIVNDSDQRKLSVFKDQIEQLLQAQGRTNNQNCLNLIQEQLEILQMLKESLELQMNKPPPSQIPFESNIQFSAPVQQNIEQQPPSPPKPVPQIQKAQSSINDDKTCIICMDKKSTHAALPCGHLKYCEKCVLSCIAQKTCFLCKQQVNSAAKIFD